MTNEPLKTPFEAKIAELIDAVFALDNILDDFGHTGKGQRALLAELSRLNQLATFAQATGKLYTFAVDRMRAVHELVAPPGKVIPAVGGHWSVTKDDFTKEDFTVGRQHSSPAKPKGPGTTIVCPLCSKPTLVVGYECEGAGLRTFRRPEPAPVNDFEHVFDCAVDFGVDPPTVLMGPGMPGHIGKVGPPPGPCGPPTHKDGPIYDAYVRSLSEAKEAPAIVGHQGPAGPAESAQAVMTCEKCSGSGHTGYLFTMRCDACSGTGSVAKSTLTAISAEAKCEHCLKLTKGLGRCTMCRGWGEHEEEPMLLALLTTGELKHETPMEEEHVRTTQAAARDKGPIGAVGHRGGSGVPGLPPTVLAAGTTFDEEVDMLVSLYLAGSTLRLTPEARKKHCAPDSKPYFVTDAEGRVLNIYETRQHVRDCDMPTRESLLAAKETYGSKPMPAVVPNAAADMLEVFLENEKAFVAHSASKKVDLYIGLKSQRIVGFKFYGMTELLASKAADTSPWDKLQESLEPVWWHRSKHLSFKLVVCGEGKRVSGFMTVGMSNGCNVYTIRHPETNDVEDVMISSVDKLWKFHRDVHDALEFSAEFYSDEMGEPHKVASCLFGEKIAASGNVFIGTEKVVGNPFDKTWREAQREPADEAKRHVIKEATATESFDKVAAISIPFDVTDILVLDYVVRFKVIPPPADAGEADEPTVI